MYTDFLRSVPHSRHGRTLDAYTDFLNRQLEVAVAVPGGRAFSDFAARLLAAQQGVIQGEVSPAAAVDAVGGPE